MKWDFELDGKRRHKLMTVEVAKALPAIGSTEGDGDDAVIGAKFFSPFGRYTFYATEFDGEDTLFGYCVSPLGADCDEWGYASLTELAEATVSIGRFPAVPAVERDLHFEGGTVGEAVKVSA